MHEENAIRYLKTGDISHLKTLVHKYQTKAIQAAYLVTHDLALAEEVVQESFMQVYKNIHQFDDNRPFKPWFMRIVINKAIKAAKKHSKSILFSDLEADRNISPEDVLYKALPSPEELVSIELLAERVLGAMEKLTPKQRTVIVLRYYLDMNENEMADSLQVPTGTVKWRLHAARQRLKIFLSFK